MGFSMLCLQMSLKEALMTGMVRPGGGGMVLET